MSVLHGLPCEQDERSLTIRDAAVAGRGDRNEWNYDRGSKHNFNAPTLNQHRNHIHFAVKAG